MSWIEVVDTAVKIGLGASITIIGGFFILWRTQSHEVKKERWRRTQDTLEHISDEFEKIHKHLVERATTDFSIIDKKAPKSMNQLLGKVPADVNGIVFEALEQSKEDFLKLHSLEGRLLLLAGKQQQKLMQKYRLTATKIEDTPISSPDAVSELKPVVDDLHLKRSNLYESISKLYANLQSGSREH